MRDLSLIPKSAFSNVKNPNKVYTFPSYTYDLLVPEERIIGHTDYVDSVAQASDLILHIERNSTDIYSDRYGIQIDDLYGKRSTYVKAKLEYRILDALSIDDRIIDIYDYTSEILDHGRKIKVSFTVESREGQFDYETVLDLFAGIDVQIDIDEFEKSFYYTYDEDGNPILVDEQKPNEPDQPSEEEEEKPPNPVDPLDPVNPQEKINIKPFQVQNSVNTQSYVSNLNNRLNNTNLDVQDSFFRLINSDRKTIL